MKIAPIDIQNNDFGQAIVLPKEFRIDDDKVYLKKDGNIIHIIPFHNYWQSVKDSLDEFTPDFMDERNQLLSQNREFFD